MRATGLALSAGLLLVAGVARGQAPLVDYEPAARTAALDGAAWRLAFRPALSVLQQTVSQLRSAPGVSPKAQVEADALMRQAGGLPEPEARRLLWQAAAVLTGKAWTPAEAFVGGLALRTPTPIWGGQSDVLTIEQLYGGASADRSSFVLDLYATQPTTSATPKLGAKLRRIATGDLAGTYPRKLPVKLDGLADGAYLLVADVAAGPARTRIVQPVYVVRDLSHRYAALKNQLAGIPGHDDAKALAEYPYALAAALRDGRREVVSYDFPRATARTSAILADLKQGRDPVYRARGLQDRAYRFPETGELVPYQVYVPTGWRVDRKWPLVVALHGANLDETNMLGRNGGAMQRLAEAYGFIVVTPLGYRLNSAYGSQRGMSRAIVGEDAVRRARSETDVLLVSDRVEKEFNVDPARRYLTGNSMGGGGTWWIGGRHADRWAAIAPAAYGGVLPEDVPALAKLPIMAVVGDRDEIGMLDRVRASVATLRAGGVNPTYVEVPGGTHAGAFETTLPDIFKFFENHAK